MKRGRDGSIRGNVDVQTRERALSVLKGLICPVLFRTIFNQPTDCLLALVAKLRPEALLDTTEAGSE